MDKSKKGLLGAISPNAKKYLDQQAQEFGKGFMKSASEADPNAKGAEMLGNTLANAPVLGVAAGGIKMAAKAPKAARAIGELPEIKPAFQGFQDLSSKALEYLKGSSEVSPQHIQNITKQEGIKQAEKDILSNLMTKYGGQQKISVPKFAEDVKKELLPLDRQTLGRSSYEGTTLRENRGNVANYSEHVYDSPIKTSAGDVHFGALQGDPDIGQGYFAHSRVEDLAPSVEDIARMGKGKYDSTRRVIEIQSDLFQKGRLENEDNLLPSNLRSIVNIGEPGGMFARRGVDLSTTDKQLEWLLNPPQDVVTTGYDLPSMLSRHSKGSIIKSINTAIKDLGPEEEYALYRQSMGETPLTTRYELLKKLRGYVEKNVSEGQSEIDKLKPYENTWHERVIREEVKKAAEDGKAKLQFPVGETAMKIEGLGSSQRWYSPHPEGGNTVWRTGVDESYLGVGKEISDNPQGDSWIITDVLGDGKFKAVPKRSFPDAPNTPEAMAELSRYSEQFDISGKSKYTPQNIKDEIRRLNEEISKVQKGSREWDILDNERAMATIYYNYEIRFADYLKKKYNAQRIKDPQGVEWFELDVHPDEAKKPIMAFGALPPIIMGLGAGGLANTQRQEKE